ncbi:MAG: CDP-diacylglycerol--serine O-phosphatidyltransferase [Oceanococcus sp.]|nr:MAG: CDP-diacylglycerol--serine O-phosphatidyltransferase [Oceanococcus sp.]
MVEPEVSKRRRGIYLLPNLFTTATLFGGFYAIVASINGRFSIAAVAVFAAMFADALDGRVARLTNTQSDFGKEYDSLADLVTFGLAAALMIYTWSLNTLDGAFWLGGKVAWLVAFIYVAGTALRLARFNVYVASDGDKGYFFGLPSPTAAALVVGFVWVCETSGLSGEVMAVPALVITLAAALLMVSNVPYRSFKDLKLSEKVPFAYVLIMVSLFVLIAMDPPRVLFGFALVYTVSGPVLALSRWRRRRSIPSDQDLPGDE